MLLRPLPLQNLIHALLTDAKFLCQIGDKFAHQIACVDRRVAIDFPWGLVVDWKSRAGQVVVDPLGDAADGGKEIKYAGKQYSRMGQLL